MLGIFSSKSVHPLADSREANRVLAEIASRAPMEAIEQAIACVESVGGDDGFKPVQRLNLLLKVDETTAPQMLRLGRDYPIRSRSRAQEAAIWEIGHGYSMQLVTSYLFCLTGYRYGEKDAEAIRPQLPLLYARLVYAMGSSLKWGQFRYASADPDFWGTLGSIYLAAVDAKLERTPLPMYANGADTTIEAEYLKVLVFQSSSLDKLTPLQMEIADRLITHFLPFFGLSREVRPENVYWVDAAKTLPPTRMAKLPEKTPTLYFFNGMRAVEAVRRTIDQLQKEGRVPPGINLGAEYDMNKVSPVLRHFEMCWALTPPVRSNARRRIISQLKVMNGMNAIHRGLSGRAGGAAAPETWLTEDISMGGLGARAPISGNDWIRIGELVAVQPEGGENWLLGIVRRYVRNDPTQGTVGIETISKAPRAVLADSGGFMTEAILIEVPEVGEYASMVLPPNAAEEGVAMLFAIDGKNARLHPRETLVTGPDYVIVNFFVQSYS